MERGARLAQVVGVWVLAVVVAAGIVVGFARFESASGTDSHALPPTLPAPQAPYKTVFIGDSVTENLQPGGLNNESQALPWPTRIASAPGSPWLLLHDAAVVGYEMSQLRDFFKDSVLLYGPQAVVIMAGINDASHDIPLDQVQESLASMVTAAQDSGAKVWIISPPPNNNYPDKIRAVVGAEAATAAQLNVPFVNVFQILGDRDGHWPAGFTVDGTHPNADGQQLLADTILKQVA